MRGTCVVPSAMTVVQRILVKEGLSGKTKVEWVNIIIVYYKRISYDALKADTRHTPGTWWDF